MAGAGSTYRSGALIAAKSLVSDLNVMDDEMTPQQRTEIDYHMLRSLADGFRGNHYVSFNPIDIAELMDRMADIIKPNGVRNDELQ